MSQVFVGMRYYQRGGYRSNAIRFLTESGADGGGVATTTYSYCLSEAERFEMARRITAALNLTRHMTTEEIERQAALPASRR